MYGFFGQGSTTSEKGSCCALTEAGLCCRRQTHLSSLQCRLWNEICCLSLFKLCAHCDYQHLVCYHVPWQIFSHLGPSETKVVTVLFKKAIPFVSQTTQFSKGKVFHRAHPLVSQKRAYNIKFA